MAGPKPFHEYAREHKLDTDVYPGADAGVRLMRASGWLLIAVLFFAMMQLALNWLTRSLMGDRFVSDFLFPYVAKVDYYWQFGVYASVAALLLCVVLYGFFLLVRWHNYERDCVANDWDALALRRSLIYSLRTTESKEAIVEKTRETKKGSGGAGKKLTLDDKAKVDALNAIKRMKVNVNTRQSLDDDSIEKQYRVSIKLPFDQKAIETLQTLIKNIDQVMNRLKEGKVSFGSQMETADHRTVKYQDAIIVPDKYQFDVVRDDGKVESGGFESSFDLSLFVDRQDEIDRKTVSANRWAAQRGRDLDELLATLQMPGKRLDMKCGATNVRYDYKMSFKIDEKRAEQLPEKLDKRFATSGSTADAAADRMSITLPLPSDRKRPINVPTLYREAFGGK